MAKIQVDHSRLNAVADTVETDAKGIKSQMAKAQLSVMQMAIGWQGKDASKFLKKWETNYEANAAYKLTIDQMEAYARYLRYVAKQYKDAQTKALNSANKLPR